ncbi:MAG: hypothetical protein NUK65_13095 [Firmicutes bacterium]|nr:hypothetical protein [Bacillota bacterium]
MATATVEAGVCGFSTTIEAVPEDRGNVKLIIDTACPNLKPLAQELATVNGMKECYAKIGESTVFEVTRKYCKHAACPVPTAIHKAIEVACKLALPRDVKMTISK